MHKKSLTLIWFGFFLGHCAGIWGTFTIIVSSVLGDERGCIKKGLASSEWLSPLV